MEQTKITPLKNISTWNKYLLFSIKNTENFFFSEEKRSSHKKTLSPFKKYREVTIF